ncbi:DUF3140 domain-containing protein [Caballeronia concitans]|uniref:DNA-binding protein n=1 Tax=Caballeronia concitans TaxID=1777133 RepID=A0A658R001_9BURK|nr:DUF3140 domain-containing protein [Caballeronia concitans]KIG10694.1 Protein of unknown function DUF3140 [Burkholderia sp. MR1]SAL35737.1 hypothetical protein AWB72_03496 [Caballeronia concitans]
MTTHHTHGQSTDEDDKAAFEEFKSLVNMTAHQLEKWLATEASRAVGQKDGDAESVGHKSGRRIIELLGAKKSDLQSDDYAHMRKVTGYVKRHLAQRPHGDIEHTKWRYSLMNWGHDPLK